MILKKKRNLIQAKAKFVVRRRKKKYLKIDITKKVEVNASELDATFEYKGTLKVVVQEILVAAGSKKSFVMQVVLEKWKSDRVYTYDELEELFGHEDFKQFKELTLRDIKTAMVVGAFYDGHLGITGKSLVSDDAGQFNNIYDNHSLCWYHEMRHYKELTPVSEHHQNMLDSFF